MLATLVGVCLAAMPAAADSAAGPDELAACAAIATPNARLVCFDELAARATNRGAAHAPAPAAPATLSAPATTTAPGPLPAAAIPASSAAREPNDDRDFGLTAAQLPAPSKGRQSIQAHIVKLTQEPLGNAWVVLDNGQTWTFVNEDPRLAPGDPVIIRRAALGAFKLITPSQHIYHARRTQ